MKEEKWEFDEEEFVYRWATFPNDALTEIDDLQCVLDHDYEEDKERMLRNCGYFGMTVDEINIRIKELQREVLEEAFQNYLAKNYPK